MSATNFDVIIIGGGAAGISAALWCDELGLKTLLLEKKAELGGQLWRVNNPIENHLGARAKNGRKLRDEFVRQVEKRTFTRRTNADVIEIDTKKLEIIMRGGEIFSARAIIAAIGVRRRKLNVAGEEKFQERGILQSGQTDAEKVAGKTAAIIGGGDAAFENALILAESAAQVYLIHRRREFSARAEFVEKVRAASRVTILSETKVKKIVGGEKLEAVELENLKTNETFELAVDGVLIRIGVIPNTELFRGKLNLSESGYIEINANCETSAPNVFAVGDAANQYSPTISTAVGNGATAAKIIYKNLH